MDRNLFKTARSWMLLTGVTFVGLIVWYGVSRQSKPSGTPEIPGVQELPGRATEVQMATPEVQPNLGSNEFQKARLTNIRSEVVAETIANLAGFDDNHIAQTSQGEAMRNGDPKDEMRRLVLLARVRRLLEYAREDPEQVVPPLRLALSEALARWPRVYAERLARELAANTAKTVIRYSEPDAFEIARVQAMVATYVLAELKDFESLIPLVQMQRTQTAWDLEHPWSIPISVPVPPAIALYSIHRLITAWPEKELSDSSKIARQKYLDWAKSNLREPIPHVTTAWDAAYDAADASVLVGDRGGTLIRAQRRIELVQYPVQYLDGADVQQVGSQAAGPRGTIWLEHCEQFVSVLQSDRSRMK